MRKNNCARVNFKTTRIFIGVFLAHILDFNLLKIISTQLKVAQQKPAELINSVETRVPKC